MILKPDQICPHQYKCHHNKNLNVTFCHGTIKRNNDFRCAYVDDNGNFINDRNNNLGQSMYNKTGKMIPINEGI